MLSQAENERLTRVGPGTEMGALFRRYWIPACLTEEVPEADGPPVRVRLLGEDLVAFRSTDGTIGLVSAYCPHRRAPMFFARNEEKGLRCVYHGWKFDTGGHCADMPSEPPDSVFKTKVSIESYPTWEGGGIVWTYMGPTEHRPAPPGHELVRTSPEHRYVSKTLEACSYLQALEGGIDPTHASIMHNMRIGDMSFLRDFDSLVAGIKLEKTDYGFTYAGVRTHPTFYWVRGYHWIMPSFHMRGMVEGLFRSARQRENEVPSIDGHIWIPIDDERCWVYNFLYSSDPAQPLPREQALEAENRLGRGEHLLPGYLPKRNSSNDYLIDRDVQKYQTMTGIAGINTQDFALQEGMGGVVDRSKEHLGTTDRAIIVLRQILFESLDALAAGGPLRAIDPVSYRNVRPVDRIVPKEQSWEEATKDDYVARF
jgi:phthalate 4,5-dioxygenase oxygenase subunit